MFMTRPVHTRHKDKTTIHKLDDKLKSGHTYDVEGMELDTAECEEAEDGLEDGLGHAHEAGGEGGADRGAEELGVGEDTARDYEEAKHEAESGLQPVKGLADGGRLPQDYAEGQKDGQGVVAVHEDHLQDTLVALFRAFLYKSEVASLLIISSSIIQQAQPGTNLSFCHYYSHLCKNRECPHGVGVTIKGEVPQGGHHDPEGDEAHAEGEQGGGGGAPQHHHGQDEVDQGRAPLDGPIHGDVHPVERDQGERAVRGEAEGAGEELHALPERVGREAGELEGPQEVQHQHRGQHLARHDEEGIVEVVAGHHGLVEEVHGDAAGEVEERHKGRLPVTPCQPLDHPGYHRLLANFLVLQSK